jgi:transcriptional regulator
VTTRKTSSPPQKAELLQGTLDMLVLRTLRRAPCHGHGIGLAIQADSGNLLRIEAGSLYPALHRLERRGWVSSEWKASEKNQRAKYYRLTPRGRKQLVFRESKWDLLVEAVARVRQPPGTEAL